MFDSILFIGGWSPQLTQGICLYTYRNKTFFRITEVENELSK